MIHHLGDRHRCHSASLIRQYLVSAGKFKQAHFATAQCQREPIVRSVQAGDAQTARQVDKAIRVGRGGVVVNAHVLERFHSRDVVRISQSVPYSHRSVEAAIVVDRFVARVGVVRVARRREARRHVPDQCAWGPVLLKCCQVSQWLDRRSRLASLG